MKNMHMTWKFCILIINSSQIIDFNSDITLESWLKTYILEWDLMIKYADCWTEFQDCMSHESV